MYDSSCDKCRFMKNCRFDTFCNIAQESQAAFLNACTVLLNTDFFTIL